MAHLAHIELVVILALMATDCAYAQSYSGRVSNLFHELSISDTCLNKARSKSAKFSYFSEDKKMAVELVNVYTQECKAYSNSDGKSFYANLNENLRSGNPKPIWKTTGNLLSTGLVLLGLQRFSNLYRSCHCQKVVKGTQFSFNQFASTTSDGKVALSFFQSGKSFIHIINTRGTDIQAYSLFAAEREILLRPEIYLYVTKVETDSKRIREEIKKLVPNQNPPNDVKMFILLDGSSTKRAKRSSKFKSTCECGRPYNKVSSQHDSGKGLLVVIILGMILQH